MKKLLGIIVLGLLWCNLSFAGVTTGYKFGKGPLKVSQNVADVLEYFFSGGKMGKYAKKQKIHWKPGLIVIAYDGSEYSYIRHPLSVTEVDNKHYVGLARKNCKKKSGKECFLFASGYKIVWDNGSDKKKRRLKKKDIMAGKTLQILQELGFYDDGIIQKKKIEKKKKETKISKTRTGKRSLAMSWEGYNDLILGSLQFNEKDLVGSLNLKLPNNDGNCKGTYALSTDKGTWSLLCDKNNMSASGTLKWNNKDGSVTGEGKDTKGKKVKFTVQGET